MAWQSATPKRATGAADGGPPDPTQSLRRVLVLSKEETKARTAVDMLRGVAPHWAVMTVPPRHAWRALREAPVDAVLIDAGSPGFARRALRVAAHLECPVALWGPMDGHGGRTFEGPFDARAIVAGLDDDLRARLWWAAPERVGRPAPHGIGA